MDIPVAALQSERVYDWAVDKVPGDPVSCFVTGPDRIGHIVTVASNADTALVHARELASQFRFHVEPRSDGSEA
jgi:hypothetical protein